MAVQQNSHRGIHYINQLIETVTANSGLPFEVAVTQMCKWIQLYNKLPPDKFAVIKIGGESVDPENGIAPEFIKDIGILARNDLYAPIVYGWGKSLTKRLTEMGFETKFDPETGDRITSSCREM